MVLIPALRAPGSPWFIVCESAAWKYDDPHYLARQAAKAAEVLGMDETTSSWYRIATLIHEGLPDLIRMPSRPRRRKLARPSGKCTSRRTGDHQERVDPDTVGAPVYG